MKSYVPALNFNAGELSPALEGRIDIDKYRAGCYKLENFIPLIQGPARRRSGTRYVKPLKDESKRGALMPFRFDQVTTYMLEWGDYCLRFYRGSDHSQVTQSAPTWNQTVGGTTTDGSVVWTNKGLLRWKPLYSLTTGDCIVDSNGNVQQAATGIAPANHTGGYEPVWPTTVGDTVTDLFVTWTCLGPVATTWSALTAYALNAAVYTPYGLMVVTTNGTSGAAAATIPYEISSPYPYTDLFDSDGVFGLAYIESLDVLYICSYTKTHRIYKLTRLGETNWTLTEMFPETGPFQALNSDDDICVYASAETGSGITLTANQDIWGYADQSRVGELFFIEQDDIRNVYQWEAGKTYNRGDRARYNGVTYESFSANGTTSGTVPPTHLRGVAADGAKGGHIQWAYRDPGFGVVRITAIAGKTGADAPNPITGISNAATAVVTCNSHGFSNGDFVFIKGVQGMEEVNDNWYKVAGATTNTFQLNDSTGTAINSTAYGTYDSGGSASSVAWTATADVVEGDNPQNRVPHSCVGSDNATGIWAHGAWSANAGYPTVVAFFRNRLTFGRDGHVWSSVSADYENFSQYTPAGLVTADMATTQDLPTFDPMAFLCEADALAIGTGGAEWVIGEINSTQPFGPDNSQTKPQLPHGARRIPAIRIGVEMLFVQWQGRKLRSLRFDWMSNSYVSADLTVLAEHVTLGGILQTAYAQEPDSIIWCVRADGQLLGFTYNREQDVTGWHRHPIGGAYTGKAYAKVESIAVIPATDHDELWLTVMRVDPNGATHRYVEYLDPQFDYDSALADAFFVDAGITLTSGSPTKTWNGLDHLEAQVVDVLADGNEHVPVTVNSGAITLNFTASKIQVGLPCPAVIIKPRLEGGASLGVAQGRVKRIDHVGMRFLNTVGGKFGPDTKYATGTLDDIPWLPEDATFDTAPQLYTGDKLRLDYPMGYETDARICYLNDKPFPATVVAIFPDEETHEPL